MKQRKRKEPEKETSTRETRGEFGKQIACRDFEVCK